MCGGPVRSEALRQRRRRPNASAAWRGRVAGNIRGRPGGHTRATLAVVEHDHVIALLRMLDANAFKNVARVADLAAAQDWMPQLLTFVADIQWAYIYVMGMRLSTSTALSPADVVLVQSQMIRHEADRPAGCKALCRRLAGCF